MCKWVLYMGYTPFVNKASLITGQSSVTASSGIDHQKVKLGYSCLQRILSRYSVFDWDALCLTKVFPSHGTLWMKDLHLHGLCLQQQVLRARNKCAVNVYSAIRFCSFYCGGWAVVLQTNVRLRLLHLGLTGYNSVSFSLSTFAASNIIFSLHEL